MADAQTHAPAHAHLAAVACHWELTLEDLDAVHVTTGVKVSAIPSHVLHVSLRSCRLFALESALHYMWVQGKAMAGGIAALTALVDILSDAAVVYSLRQQAAKGTAPHVLWMAAGAVLATAATAYALCCVAGVLSLSPLAAPLQVHVLGAALASRRAWCTRDGTVHGPLSPMRAAAAACLAVPCGHALLLYAACIAGYSKYDTARRLPCPVACCCWAQQRHEAGAVGQSDVDACGTCSTPLSRVPCKSSAHDVMQVIVHTPLRTPTASAGVVAPEGRPHSSFHLPSEAPSGTAYAGEPPIHAEVGTGTPPSSPHVFQVQDASESTYHSSGTASPLSVADCSSVHSWHSWNT